MSTTRSRATPSQHSRLHIPLIFGVDAVHGFGHPWQAPLFPQSIGMGATWDPAVGSSRRCGHRQRASRATGWVWAFAPVQDLARDNRWGRTYETWAEEPALSAAMGSGQRQGACRRQKPAPLDVSATVKHFAGYSESINGHDRNEALLPLDYLESMILPSYAGGIDAGAGTVMVDSGSINGIPATAVALPADRSSAQPDGLSRVLSSATTRTCRHCRAPITSSPTWLSAIAKAVNAGVDMAMDVTGAGSMADGDPCRTCTLDLISMARIDQAVRRILTLKFQLGLFDQACVNDPSKPCVDADAANAAVTSWTSRDAQGGPGIDDSAAQREQRPAALARPPRSSSPARAPTR